MTIWDFRVMLNREPDSDEYDRLVEAGMDDCVLTGGSQPSLMCDREADSLLEAVVSVLAQIRQVNGLWGVSVGHGDAVTLGDAARRHGGRTQASLRQLASGQRGPGGFPEPLMEADNVSVYSWAEISDWLRTTMGDDLPPGNRDLALADAAVKLACRARAMRQEPLVRRLLEVA
ncbi:hypothetical protein [Nonomuraea cavernae]|uniref:DNA-binding protein n=1 Tax=Nonomuraea cavernae TaxID=2045107 RepID=A0A917ZET2_9ACTN|nr:hypothetical protein [Nonomuraea cavernae]MCA2190015.1 hypothetical protein [Nonomuraea cavernae]GGO81518.1 hypothetical protein GCM10012289_70660 [Nonomuraea cavernae]